MGWSKARAAYPASSPYVVACGGTSATLRLQEPATIRGDETLWDEVGGGGLATGGGVSAVYPVPSWQGGLKLPTRLGDGGAGRGVRDIAANASPGAGYLTLVDLPGEPDPKWLGQGGTSAVAPLRAGLIVRIRELRAAVGGLGSIHAALYGASGTDVFRDVVGPCSTLA